MLAKIKILLGIKDNSKDALLSILIEEAINEAINYTNNNAVADQAFLISKLVAYKYNRLGTEGVQSEDYSGVSFQYTSDYPDDIKRYLNSFRKVRTI